MKIDELFPTVFWQHTSPFHPCSRLPGLALQCFPEVNCLQKWMGGLRKLIGGVAAVMTSAGEPPGSWSGLASLPAELLAALSLATTVASCGMHIKK